MGEFWPLDGTPRHPSSENFSVSISVAWQRHQMAKVWVAGGQGHWQVVAV